MGGPVLRVRMGVHTGEAEERDGDFFGPVVNRAARIMGAANGGQVLVSDLTAGLVEQVAEVKLIDLGSIELKGVIEPACYAVASGPATQSPVDPPSSRMMLSRSADRSTALV